MTLVAPCIFIVDYRVRCGRPATGKYCRLHAKAFRAFKSDSVEKIDEARRFLVSLRASP